MGPGRWLSSFVLCADVLRRAVGESPDVFIQRPKESGIGQCDGVCGGRGLRIQGKVVEEGIGSATRLEHKVVAIVESQPADDDVPILVMIAIEAFGRARFVTPKCYTVVGIVYAHRTASCAIASELDAIAIAGEIGTLVEILIYPRVVFGIA